MEIYSQSVDYTNMTLNTENYGFWQAVEVEGSNVPTGRCYAVFVTIDESLWMYGGYHRPAQVERLLDLWRLTTDSSLLMV